MSRFLRALVFTLIVTAAASGIGPVAAINQLNPADCTAVGINCALVPPASAAPLAAYAITIINGLLVLIGIIALVAIIYGGIKYLTSAGDTGSAEEAKKTIVYAVIGLIVIGLALIIVNFIAGIAGVAILAPPGGINLPGGANLPGTIITIITAFLVLVGIAAFIYLIYGGVKYITSAGDSSSAEEAKKTILYAIIGVIVIGIAAITVNFVGGIAGINTAIIPGGSNLPGSILIIINGFLVLVGVVALIYLIIGGLRYITSQGDSGAAEEAKKTILYAVIGLIAIGVSAVAVNFVLDQAGLEAFGIPGQSSNLALTIFIILNGFLTLVGIVALVFIIIGAARYITSQGDSSATEEAKNTILYALVGLIVIGIAAVVVNFVLSAIIGQVPIQLPPVP